MKEKLISPEEELVLESFGELATELIKIIAPTSAEHDVERARVKSFAS